jgi:hypothetical protein
MGSIPSGRDEVGFRRCSDCLSFTHRHGYAFAHPISGRRSAYSGFSLKLGLEAHPPLTRLKSTNNI